mgnify:CR=1 FL=1
MPSPSRRRGPAIPSSAARQVVRGSTNGSPLAATGRGEHAGAEKLPTEGTTVVAVENDLAELKGIGPKHAAMLKEIGVARVFTPGAPTHEITGWVAEHFGVQADAS